ncbi:MAG: L-2-amino-thiazoline-4-carboxylic acid hydrolase [Acidobacteriaceae bacterium]
MAIKPFPASDYLNVVGLLNRREIEVRLLAPLLEALSAEFGRERVYELTRQVIQQIALQQGLELGRSVQSNDLEHLAIALEAWQKDNTIQIEVLQLNRKKYCFNVYRCRFAEMYHHLGLGELGIILSCERDFAHIAGYNSNIRLIRSQTIMQGAEICDFRYELNSARKHSGRS